MRLRGSYGFTGSVKFDSYQAVTTYKYNSSYLGYTGVGAIPMGMANPDLKWQTTKKFNIGLTSSFFGDRLNVNLDFYNEKTCDMLIDKSLPPSSGATSVKANLGSQTSNGFEFSLWGKIIKTKDWEWNLSYNFTWQNMKVKNLSLTKGGSQTNVKVGPSIDAYQFQVLSEGYEPYMFYVYHQLYDSKTGKPIEGAYADLNNDGEINESDLYRYHSPAPKYIMGLSTSLRYKQLTLGMSFRANIDNYVYNGMGMSTGAFETVSYNNSQLNNLNTSFLKTGFKTRQYLSDYYVENASFLKLDNLSLSYNVGKINKWASLTVSAMVQNVFTITGYSGTDPEVPNGMDNSFYPRPRTYSVSLGLQF